MTAEEVEVMDEGYMLVQEAQEFNEDAQPGDLLEMEVPVSAFGRQAIQTAKQFLIQRIRTAERDKIYETYRSRIGTMINGEVVRIENKNLIVSIGRQTEAVLPAKEQIAKERFHQGSSVKAVIADVADSTKGGAQVILSRANGDFLKELFRQEVPEIYEGTVEMKGVSRDPGFRAKIAVYSRDERIDPVGSCVGMKGARVQAIVRELANERIDIVHWNPDLETYVRRSLAPANIVKFVEVSGTRRIVLVVADEDLAQAIGRNGQNVRLASQLVGRDLDVFGEKEWSEKDEETKEKILTPRANEYRQMNQANDRKMQLDELFTKDNTEDQPIEEDGVSMEDSEA
jgi:N utilization substance protein A